MTAAFQKLQYEFAAHIREPSKNPAPEGIEDRRLAIYRDLFYNNVENFIANTFPVARSLHSDKAWHSLVRDFFAHHACQTPYFLEISQEFLQFLEQERDDPADPPFLLELAHYEWVELGVAVDASDVDLEKINVDGNLLDAVPVISPAAWLLSYEFPVHKISPEFQPETAPEQPTFLVVSRRNDDTVEFTELNPALAHMLELLKNENNKQTGREILTDIASSLGFEDPGQVIQMGQEMLDAFKAKDIVLGTKK